MGAVCIHLNPVLGVQAHRGVQGARADNKPKDTGMPKPRCVSGLSVLMRRSRTPPNPLNSYGEGKKQHGKKESPQRRLWNEWETVAWCLSKVLPPVLGPGKGPGCGAGLGPTPQPPGVPGRSGVRGRSQPASNCPPWSLSVCASGDRVGGRPDLRQERGVPKAAQSWRGRLTGAGHGRVCLHSLLL